jgi:Na+/proline symporter
LKKKIIKKNQNYSGKMDDDDDLLLDNHNVIEPLNEHNNCKIKSLREWFIWSYLNVIIGGVILGLIAIGCSFRTNKFKQRQNYSKANKWSRVTFIVNSLTTLCGLTFFGYLIVRYFHNISIEQKTTGNLNYPK